MAKSEHIKSTGGVAPFGYLWQDGELIVDEREAPVRKVIYELFIKHRRKKTVAKLLNDLGYRTRNGALFSDTTVDRLIRDTTAKGIRVSDGKEIKVPAIISEDAWKRANTFLGNPRTKEPIHLFAGLAFCSCGGKMIVPSSVEKYVCLECRRKIGTEDLEEIFVSQIKTFPVESENNTELNLTDYWVDLAQKEKRIIVEQTLNRIVIGKTEIEIEFAFTPNSLKTAAVWQRNIKGNETPEAISQEINHDIPINQINEPLLSETEAAQFLGISKMTLLRRRNAGEIGFFRVGFRVLYSKEKHLLPFLAQCEKGL